MIELKKVSKKYEMGGDLIHALSQVDLKIKEGDFIAIMGPSGSGKSTLANVIGGLDNPDSGQVFIEEKDITLSSDNHLSEYRNKKIGFVFQNFNLHPHYTALENVALPMIFSRVSRFARMKRAADCLREVGLENRMKHKPNELSGGQRQRVCIARAIVNNPQIIIADEPTGNLDSQKGAEILKILKKLNREKNITLLVITHDPAVAKQADRIIHLYDGKLSDMNLFDYISMAFRNLFRQKLRTFLTIAAIMIGAISVMLMLSVVIGARKTLIEQIESIGGLTLVTVSPNVDFEDNGNLFTNWSWGDSEKILSEESIKKLKALPNVVGASPTGNLHNIMSMKIAGGEKKFRVNMIAFDPDTKVFETPLIAGRQLQSSDMGKIIISGTTLKNFAYESKAESIIGKKVTLQTGNNYTGWGVAESEIPMPPENADRDWWDAQQKIRREIQVEIIGVLDGGPMQEEDFTNIQWARQVNIFKNWEWDDGARKQVLKTYDEFEKRGYDAIMVKADKIENVDAVAESIRKLDMGARTAKEMIDAILKATQVVGYILGAIGAIALFIAAIGIINTMIMSIYERTKEIGVMRACGAKRSTIRRLFTIESALIGFFGGAFGILASFGIGKFGNFIAYHIAMDEGLPVEGFLSFPNWLIFSVLAFTTLIGMLAGLYPAFRAARLSPVEALRYE